MAGKKTVYYKRAGSFVMRHGEWLSSPAYRSLSCNARCLLEEFQRIYRPGRNGKLSISVENACQLLNVKSETTMRKAYRELEDRAFITIEREAAHYIGKAREYRLTFEPSQGRLPCDDWKDWKLPRTVLDDTSANRKKRISPPKSDGDPVKYCRGMASRQMKTRKIECEALINATVKALRMEEKGCNSLNN